MQKIKFGRNLLLVFISAAIGFPTVATTEATASSPAAIAATPAVWIAKSPTATVYLMGSVHVLKPNVSWHTPQIARDIAQSQELWLELADPENESHQVLALIRKYGASTDGPLTKKLSPEDLAALDKAAQGIRPNSSAAFFDPIRPWVVSLELVAVELRQSGYDLQSGVELTLRAEFKSAGKPVNGLETAEQQIKVLADMTPEEELTQLHEILKDYGRSKEIDDLVDAWAKADLAAIARSELDQMKSDSPALYDRLITQRNIGMAKAIKARLDGKGVAFVAVGALHLVGKDSVQSQLVRLGVKVERQ